MASSPITSWQIDEETMETVTDFFVGSKITADHDCSHEIKRRLLFGRKADQHRQQNKKQRGYFVNKGLSSPNYGSSSSHVWMWELDHKEDWGPKNWCFWTVMLEKTLVSPLDCKEIKPVNPKGNQSWIFIGRTDSEAEAPILWPPHAKSWLIGKDPDDGKDWRQEEKGMTEDEMVGWHHQLNGHEFQQALGDGKGQEGLACCSPWGRKQSDTTEQLNNNKIGTSPLRNCQLSGRVKVEARWDSKIRDGIGCSLKYLSNLEDSKHLLALSKFCLPKLEKFHKVLHKPQAQSFQGGRKNLWLGCSNSELCLNLNTESADLIPFPLLHMGRINFHHIISICAVALNPETRNSSHYLNVNKERGKL